MRFLLVIICAFALARPGYGQTQEKGMLNRVLDAPDHPFTNEMNGKAYNGAGSLDLKAADTKSYGGGEKSFTTDGYTTRSFFGIKNPWFGHKVYATDKATDLTKGFLADGNKKFATQDAAVKPFYDSKKDATVATTKAAVPTQPFLVQGVSQGALDQNKKKLTIDDIREILNKDH